MTGGSMGPSGLHIFCLRAAGHTQPRTAMILRRLTASPGSRTHTAGPDCPIRSKRLRGHPRAPSVPVGCVNAFMRLVGTHGGGPQGGRVGALGFADPLRRGSARWLDEAVPALA